MINSILHMQWVNGKTKDVSSEGHVQKEKTCERGVIFVCRFKYHLRALLNGRRKLRYKPPINGKNTSAINTQSRITGTARTKKAP
jgi:hypothetical protein